MPIEYECVQCDTRMVSPDGDAGKKSRCLRCGKALTIPWPVPTRTVHCFACGEENQVADDITGAELRCPTCGKRVLPISKVCPECGSKEYTSRKPETFVAFASDRV